MTNNFNFNSQPDLWLLCELLNSQNKPQVKKFVLSIDIVNIFNALNNGEVLYIYSLTLPSSVQVALSYYDQNGESFTFGVSPSERLEIYNNNNDADVISDKPTEIIVKEFNFNQELKNIGFVNDGLNTLELNYNGLAYIEYSILK